MSSNDLGILNVLVVERGEFPVRWLIFFSVNELRHLAEHSDLLDEVSENLDVDRKPSLTRGGLNHLALILLEFLDPDRHNFLQLGTGQVAERSVLASLLAIMSSRVLFQPITKSFTKFGIILIISKSANDSNYLLPVLKVRIMNDVPDILASDRC